MRSLIVVLPFVSFALAFVPVACGGSKQAPPEDDSALTAQACDALKNAAQSDSFFASNPHTGTSTLRSGQVVPTPLRIYDGDDLIMLGTADHAALEAMATGSGIAPYQTQGNRGFAFLYVSKVRCGDIGAYNESFFAFYGSKTGGVIPWVNAFSAFVPAANPATVAVASKYFVVSSQVSVDYGRELLSLDKSLGQLEISPRPDLDVFTVSATDGQKLFYGSVHFDGSDAAKAASAAGFATALGLKSPADLQPPPPVSPFPLVTSLHDGSPFKIFTSLAPTEFNLNEWHAEDQLSIDEDAFARFDRNFAGIDFKPTVTLRIQDAKSIDPQATALTTP
jgi:hypothetical protein